MMKMAILVVIAVAAAALLHGVQTVSLEEMLFESFMSNYSRSYREDPVTRADKFRVFQQSLARQKMLNEYEREHNGTAVYGINQFSDLTPEEFKATYLSPARKLPQRREVRSDGWKTSQGDRLDWREKGVIGPIRDQKQCGSCWAFAVVETIESAYAIERQQKLNFILSSQQLISCDKRPTQGLNGCSGGVLQKAFDILQVTQEVVVSETTYPFASSDGKDLPCNTNLPRKGLVLINYTYIGNADLDSMTTMLQEGPVTTSVNAVPWQDYIGGIVQHHCTNAFVDHAVQVVGYDLTGDVPYWIVRNTWGEKWGEKGYIRVLHGTNMCGIRDEVAAVHSVKSIGL